MPKAMFTRSASFEVSTQISLQKSNIHRWASVGCAGTKYEYIYVKKSPGIQHVFQIRHPPMGPFFGLKFPRSLAWAFRQGRILAVWILAAKLPNSDLTFAWMFGWISPPVFSKEKGPKECPYPLNLGGGISPPKFRGLPSKKHYKTRDFGHSTPKIQGVSLPPPKFKG